VVVKIQRPNIETIIATDLAALRTVGFWLKRYQPISKRVDVPALLAEFTRVLYEEIDYITEGHNAETFAAIFTDNPGVRVPGVVWTHTTKRALTLEDVGAIKITDYDAITAAGIDRAEVAKRLFNTYLKQIFEDGFFHADPHPGNLFVTPIDHSSDGDQSDEVDWQLTFIDFGMVGRLPNKLREGLRELVIGVGLQDATRVVKSYQLLGVLLPNADLTLLEKAGAKMFEMFWGRNMSELQDVSLDEMHEFAEEFRDLMYSMPFQIPQDIIFLVRCVGILSGMCTGLDPDFNLWEGLAPFAQKLITEEASSARETILEVLSTMARRLLAMPGRVDAILMKVERGELAVHDPHLSRQLLLLERTIRRGVGAIIFAVLLIGGIQLFLAHYPFFGILLMVGAALSLLWILFTGRWR
jgi:predicted unusual protein kinase regulating ubiquinone biosynthesis (AarF/ABC1/UbiB family)